MFIPVCQKGGQKKLWAKLQNKESEWQPHYGHSPGMRKWGLSCLSLAQGEIGVWSGVGACTWDFCWWLTPDLSQSTVLHVLADWHVRLVLVLWLLSSVEADSLSGGGRRRGRVLRGKQQLQQRPAPRPGLTIWLCGGSTKQQLVCWQLPFLSHSQALSNHGITSSFVFETWRFVVSK